MWKTEKTEDKSKNRNSEWKTECRNLFSSQNSQAFQYSQDSQDSQKPKTRRQKTEYRIKSASGAEY